VKHRKTLAMVWGSRPPAFSIGYDEPMGKADSGFTVIFDDAPSPENVAKYANPTKVPGIRWMCLGCLLEEHPEVGRGLDIARQHRVADLDDNGEWVIGDLSRLED
jgi:hypothetical protein